MPEYHSRTSEHPLVVVAALVIVIAGFKVASNLITPLLFATFISIAVGPLFVWLRKRKVPAGIAALVVVLIFLTAIGLIALLLGGTVNQFSHSLPLYQSHLNGLTADFLHWLRTIGFVVPDDSPLGSITPGTVMNLVGNLLSQLASFLADGLLILLTVVFILLEASGFPRKLTSVLKNPTESVPRFEHFMSAVHRYVALKTVISIATGLLIWLWLLILGVDLAPLWGFLAFLLNYIPNIGSILAAVPAVLLALVQLGPGSAVAALVGYLAVNNILGNIVEPRIMGKGMGLSTLVVFVSLVFWGWVFGTIGMLLSVPLTMTLKIGFESSPRLSWISKLLADKV